MGWKVRGDKATEMKGEACVIRGVGCRWSSNIILGRCLRCLRGFFFLGEDGSVSFIRVSFARTFRVWKRSAENRVW